MDYYVSNLFLNKKNMRMLSKSRLLTAMVSALAVCVLSMPAAFAAGGDGASSNIELLDTNGNGEPDRITFQIANPNGESWSLTGAAPYGISVTQDGDDITVDSVTITSATTANPVLVQVDLDEDDVDLSVNTDGVNNSPVELIYTQGNGGTNCTVQDCITDDTDEELNAINTGDSDATDTEADAMKPVPVEAYLSDDTDNGQLDAVLIAWSENLNTLADATGSFSISSASDFAALTEVDAECGNNGGTSLESECYYEFTTTTFKTDIGDIELAYSGAGVTDGTNTADAYTFTSASTVPFIDNSAPHMLAVDFGTTAVSGITYNSIEIDYSEPVLLSRDASSDTDIANGNSAASTGTLGAMTTARQVEGLLSWAAGSGGDLTTNAATDNTVVLSADGTTVTVLLNGQTAGYFDSGSTAPTTPVVTVIRDFDDLTDTADIPVSNGSNPTETNSASWDVTAPTIATTYSCDTDGDDDVDRIQADFSESMLDASLTAGNFEVDNDDTNDGTGEEVPASLNTATGGCDGNADDTDANDGKVRFDLTTGIAGTDAAYLHHVTAGARDWAGNRLATGDALGTETDKAGPPQVTGLAAGAATSNSFALSWTAIASSDFDNYKVYYGTTPSVTSATGSLWGEANDAALGTIGTTSTTVNGLSSATSYYFVIYSVDADGNLSLVSTEVSKLTSSGGGGTNLLSTIGSSGSGSTTNSNTSSDDNSSDTTSSTDVEDVFTDMVGHWSAEYVQKLYDKGIVEGRADNKFEPDALVTRAELLKMALEMYSYSASPDGSSGFTDVNSDHWFFGYVRTAVQNGFVDGYDDGTFKPNNPISRVEALALVLKVAKMDVSGVTEATFPDTDAEAWYSDFISFAVNFDIVQGYANGNFGPTDGLTRGQAAKIIVLVFEL